MNYISYKMRTTLKLLIVLFVSGIVLSSCNDMLSVDSDRLVSSDEYTMNASGDSVYSTFGVLSRLQKLADCYVLLGELRGDLMSPGDKADVSLQEISNCAITKDNKYINQKYYYDVINNCNYILQKLDTNVMDAGKKLKLRQYAALKGIRAWTYMQIALTFKTAKYYENPILTVADAEKTYPEYGIEELFTVLINDLTPLTDAGFPTLGTVDGYNTSYSYFDINILLGDLYLWRASLTDTQSDYEQAAMAYHKAMNKNYLIVYKQLTSAWATVNNTINTKSATLSWISSFDYESITKITCPTEYGTAYWLDTLNNQRLIVPSALSLSNWDNQMYYLNAASNTKGDLRKYGSISYSDETNSALQTDYSFTGFNVDKYLIYKYKIYQQNPVIYKSSLVYLRYAEALNRLKKPSFAFAVLKYGLNSTNVLNNKIIRPSEKPSPLPDYLNFDIRFSSNTGTHMRGCGNIDQDTTYFVFPRKTVMSLSDSILFVEDKIVDELALETAYEGNRFQDLMRFAYRRKKTGEGDESYLANKVASKSGTLNTTMQSHLKNDDNWYILYK